MKIYGRVYVIKNTCNSKVYVGQTIGTLENRFKAHCASKGKCRAIESAIQKYGSDKFSIELVQEASSKEELDFLEKIWIQAHNSLSPNGYNLREGGGSVGKMSLESRKRLSRATSTEERARQLKEILSRPEVKAKLKAAGKANWASKAEKMNLAKSKPEVECRRKQLAAKAWENEELRIRHSSKMAEVTSRTEYKELQSKISKKWWASLNEDEKAKRVADMSAWLKGHKKKINKSPEAVAKRSEARKKSWITRRANCIA